MFFLEDLDVIKEVKDILFDKEFFLLEKLFKDCCLDVRVVVVEGCCRIFYLFWEIILLLIIIKMIIIIFDDMFCDVLNDVRFLILKGVIYLLGNF